MQGVESSPEMQEAKKVVPEEQEGTSGKGGGAWEGEPPTVGGVGGVLGVPG